MEEKLIIEKIKEFRALRDMSLDKLAELTGFTKGYLSRIENSTKAPPIATLSRISQALGVDIVQFFSEDFGSAEPRDFSIIKKNERLEVGGRGTPYGYVYEALAYRMTGKNMEPYIVTIGFHRTANFQHEGEEFFHLLEGKLELFLAGKSYFLERGDSVYLKSNIPHSGRSLGKNKAKMLIVICS